MPKRAPPVKHSRGLITRHVQVDDRVCCELMPGEPLGLAWRRWQTFTFFPGVVLLLLVSHCSVMLGPGIIKFGRHGVKTLAPGKLHSLESGENRSQAQMCPRHNVSSKLQTPIILLYTDYTVTILYYTIIYRLL